MGEHVAAQRYAVVDVETSGLNPRRHRLLQVGVVVVDQHGAVLDRWSTLVAPRSRWFFRVGPTHIHGISRSRVRSGRPLAEVLAQLDTILRDARFVGHNASFDVAFLRQAARRHGIELPLDEPVCTLELSRRLDPDRQQRHRLVDLCQRYDVQLVRPHDALADADATAAVLVHLLREHGVESIDQLPVAS